MPAGTTVTLKASDGHSLDAYMAAPKGMPKGGLVVVQEIFGVSGHIKQVADAYAADGYLAIAPAMFDRIGKNLVFSYTQIEPGRDAVGELTDDMILADVMAAITAASAGGKVAVVGYCWGGAVAYLAASKANGVAGAIDYYGTRTIQFSETMKPRVPVLYHFGSLDKSIPPDAIAKIKAVDPSGRFHVYERAEHGFNCTERSSYNGEAARMARHRTLAFLKEVT